MTFMDYKSENREGACTEQVGIIGIWFQSPQLEEELIRLLTNLASAGQKILST